VPSPESGVRQVKLDTIPADLVESVEINKTLSANQDGDSIGGTVNLVTRTAADTTTVSAFGQFGHTPILNGVYADQFGVTAGKRFLGNKRLGILGNYTYDYNGRGIDDVEPTPDTGTFTPSYDSIDMREISTTAPAGASRGAWTINSPKAPASTRMGCTPISRIMGIGGTTS